MSARARVVTPNLPVDDIERARGFYADVRRFLVRDPDGNVVNLVQHRG